MIDTRHCNILRAGLSLEILSLSAIQALLSSLNSEHLLSCTISSSNVEVKSFNVCQMFLCSVKETLCSVMHFISQSDLAPANISPC